MRYLLDTHTFIWFVTDSSRLSIEVKKLIEEDYNEKIFSVVSIWEMAIKHSVGRLSFDIPFPQFIEREMRLNSMELMQIKVTHINIISSLPLHHRDPFDRLLIAQALFENMPILSVDTAFDAYAVQRIW